MSSALEGDLRRRPPEARATSALETDLRRDVRGEIRFDPASRALYATDASNYRQTPIGVVVPLDEDDVVATVAACARHEAPVLSRGGGTSLSGQCCNEAVVIDFSKHVRGLVELDPERRRARVQPGIVLDDLRAAAERHGLTFAPDPATHQWCTLGGMIGNNSCGVHSIISGRTSDNVESLDVLTYDGLRLTAGATSDDELERIVAEGGRCGEIYARLRALRDRYAPLVRERFPDIPRRVSGYNLDELLPERGFNVARALVGSEGTCVTVLEATLELVHSPAWRTLVVLGYPDVFAAADHVPAVMAQGPIGLEGLDDQLVDNVLRTGLHEADVRLLPEGHGWLMAEFGGDTQAESLERAHAAVAALEGDCSAAVFEDIAQQRRIWHVRESGFGATIFIPGKDDAWEGWDDAAVAPERLGAYLREFRALTDSFGYRSSLYGHFGHGCVHTLISFDFASAGGVARFREFVEQGADLVVRHGGSLSGEHGDGQGRAELLGRMFGPELVGAFREFKAIWDPDGRMNPGKVVDPYRVDEHLRLPSYSPPASTTHFSFREEGGTFARAGLRCVGLGACRKTHTGTMCPSYMVTRDEQHSTRGRGHLLFEMLRGDPLEGDLGAEAVHDALDLCLACKGCKGECPVSTDMATYKAEFLSHHYAGRLRPRSAYAMGLVHWWAALGSVAPGAANAVLRQPRLAELLKRVAGVAPERSLPQLAGQTFRRRFHSRARPRARGEPVILWADTFNDNFHPEAAEAAVEVLEAAGRSVLVPRRRLCCGRPLYDFGMLDLAKRLLSQLLQALRPAIRAGVPLVAIEPSCLAVFRDELCNLLPDDPDAERLAAQSFGLADFLARDGYEPPPLPQRKALVHGHCHQKALFGMAPDERLLGALGLDFELLDSGCCGMAGAFGFEREHYDVSRACGERVLLPAVRDAAPDTLIVADGFSCREQVRQETGRETVHLAQLLRDALRA